MLASVLGKQGASGLVQEAHAPVQAGSQDTQVVTRDGNASHRLVHIVCEKTASPDIKPPDGAINTACNDLLPATRIAL